MDKNKNDINELNEANSLLNQHLCNFISSKFLFIYRDLDGTEISQNKYAELCGLSSSTLSKIKSSKGYDMPLTTLYNICRHERCSLKEFFDEFEGKYGKSILP
tara:strand:+ start:710 stop:1018 length:309 start_codon:yes stop_codon:yes gene_type:complete